MAEKKDRVGQMRENFESKYGSPTGSGKVLIGMKSGKAVYGDELDAVDTSGANVINNTYSQNQAIMDGMFKEMGRSGGMYTPSTPDIRRAEQLSPPTEADYKVTTRADGKKMVGAYSPEAAAMREPSNDDARFLQTLNRLNARPNNTSKFSDTDPFPSALSPTKPPSSQNSAPPPQPNTAPPVQPPSPNIGGSLNNVALASGLVMSSPQMGKPPTGGFGQSGSVDPYGMDQKKRPNARAGLDQNSLFESMSAFGIDPSEWGY